jgi:hypothetical protein
MKQLIYSDSVKQFDVSAAEQCGSTNKEQPTELKQRIYRVRGSAFDMLEALIELQPFINGWQGSEEGKAIAQRVNRAIDKATGGHKWAFKSNASPVASPE